MPDSVPNGDTSLDIVEMVGDRWLVYGDARAVWDVIEICTTEGRPLPDWVVSYLARVAREMPKVHRRDLLSLWRAVGLYGERKGGYDRDNDPENIYQRIEQMIADREVRNVAQGARLYVERYGVGGDPEKIRKRYYEGRKITAQMPIPDGTEPEAQACRYIINTRTGQTRIETR